MAMAWPKRCVGCRAEAQAKKGDVVKAAWADAFVWLALALLRIPTIAGIH